MSPSVRGARLADLPQLLALMRAFSQDDEVVWRPRRVRPALARLLRRPALGRVLVLVEQGALVGYVVGTFGYDLEFGGADAFVTELFVDARYRGTGQGRRLLEAIASAMGRAGASALHLAVRPANRVARRLYASAGFTPTPRLVLSKALRRARARGDLGVARELA